MSPVKCHIQGVEAEGETPLGALVACLLEHSALEHLPDERANVLEEAKEWAAASAILWEDVVGELRRAAEELGDSGSLVKEAGPLAEETDECPHEELEFSGSVEFESGALVFHVNCRACGRSGSATVTNEDVLW
jgi:hypothetical protein